MTKTLEMVFKNTTGKDVILRLVEPKDNVTLTEVMTVMESIVTKNIFTTTGGELVEAVSARINSRDVVELV